VTTVTVTPDDLSTVADAGSVIMITGTDTAGNRIRFGGDARPMAAMLGDVADGTVDEASCEVEPWQVLGVQPWPPADLEGEPCATASRARLS
jgi:hypothetical protein